MVDELSPAVRRIQKRFRDFSVDVREERVIRYIAGQLRMGRRIDDIFQDSYVLAHTTEAQRSQILENPALIRAIEEEIKRQFADYACGTAESGGEAGPVKSQALRARTWEVDPPDPPEDAWGQEPLTCRFCGVENTPDSNFCRRCGARLRRPDASESTLVFTPADQDTGNTSAPVTSRIAGTVLVIRAGGGREGEVIPLGDEVLTIGRSPHSDLFLDDVTVSRHHARIVRDEHGFLVEDLNSLNGTYVNRRRIERHLLTHGDELQIGKFKLAFLEHADEV